jgi:hypothetical protein
MLSTAAFQYWWQQLVSGNFLEAFHSAYRWLIRKLLPRGLTCGNATIQQIFVYPVKSCAGIELEDGAFLDTSNCMPFQRGFIINLRVRLKLYNINAISIGLHNKS